MRRNPVFSLTVILTLALGLGATTAVFSSLYATVLKAPPYPDPQQLVAVHNLHLARPHTSAFDYFDLRSERDLFTDLGVYFFLDLSRTGIEQAKKVNAVAMTSSMFDTLGVQPLLGRTFTPDEQRFHGPHALIVSETFWRNALGADPEILKRSLELDGERYPIVGVMPRAFQFPNEVTQMWAPVAFRPEELASRDKAAYYLHMVARLRPGIAAGQASVRIGEISRRLAGQPDHSERDQPGWQFFLLPMARDDDGSVRRWMTILFTAVSGLLILVCSNIAGLLLVRAIERRFDFALRLALGAGRWRIAGQALTEVLLLAVCGGAAGLAVAKLAVHALTLYGPGGKTVQFESPVFWFGAVLTLATGIACGLYPAWTASRGQPIDALHQGGHQRTAGFSKRRWQQGLIVLQVTIATTLLLSGVLLLRSFLRLINAPLGFEARGVLTFQIDLPRQRYPTPESRAQFFEQIAERSKRIPGVDFVAGCSLLPFGYGENVTPFEIAGSPKPRSNWYSNVNQVSPGYLAAMQIPLLRGRFFTPQELTAHEPVAVIDQAFAERFLPDQDPIGQTLQTPRVTARIVGVVGGVKTTAIDLEAPPTIYFPGPATTFVLRSRLPLGPIAANLPGIVAQIDKNLPVYDVQPLEEWVNHSLKTRRFVAFLVAVFGISGALLSALGLYGVVSYWIAIRRREIGIRMALGATSGAIGAMVYSSGLRLVIAGTIFGCAGAAAAHRLIASRLYGVRFTDPVTWMAVAAAVLLAGIVACALPAWRAARTNALDALK
jgi:putative ABC transport system permease protein